MTSARNLVRVLLRDRLRDPAADVVPGQDRPLQAKFADQPEHAARLRGGAVLLGRVGRVLIRLAESPQVRDNDVEGGGQIGREDAVVGAVTGPAVQQDHRLAGAGAVVAKLETVDRLAAGHRHLRVWTLPAPSNYIREPPRASRAGRGGTGGRLGKVGGRSGTGGRLRKVGGRGGTGGRLGKVGEGPGRWGRRASGAGKAGRRRKMARVSGDGQCGPPPPARRWWKR